MEAKKPFVLSFARSCKFTLLIALGLAATSAPAQLQWSSYNTSGTLVTANVASGGDATYGGSVTFTIPASTQLAFITKSFAPFSLAAANSKRTVTFKMTASGGISSGRCLGWGLYNSAGSDSLNDDVGYFGLWNAGGPYNETYDHAAGTANLFSGTHLGQGGTYTGPVTAGSLYTNQIQLIMNSSGTGISLGNGGSSLAAAGLAIIGVGVTQYAYCNPVTPLLGGVSTFDEFGFMLNNSTASPVTVTLSGITLAPANPVLSSAPQNYSGSAGSTATFTAVVNTNALAPFGYQWYATNSAGNVVALTDGATGSGAVISGSSSVGSSLYTNVLTFSNAQGADNNGNIFVVVTNAYGAITSAPVVLTILPPTQPNSLVVAPASATVISGQSTNFAASCIASPTPDYYWYGNNGALLQSGGNATLTLNNVQLSGAGTYSVVASNYLGTATNTFVVNVIVPPCFAQQPTNVLVNLGNPVDFIAVEGGCALPAPTYQWYKNGTLIPGATATNYPITSVAWADLGKYSVVISNSAGFVTSSNVVLAIYSTNLVGAPVGPANGATGVCYDTPLYLRFNAPVAIVNAGKIRIYNVTNSTTPVDTID
ncbi:MAG TPA: immunoglobulin domain-containing protein, partial [Verrucomicrobiae bacterium]